MPSKVQQTPAELGAHLAEQLAFLETSAKRFDEGVESEAKRIAHHIRILVHHTGASSALLVQLGRLDELAFCDSTHPNPAGNIATYDGLLITAHMQSGMKYFPKLDSNAMQSLAFVPFADWWNAVVFVDSKRRTITRKELVLAIANQDGGAHVDPALDAKYAGLSRENSLGWTTHTGGKLFPMGPPHLAAVRQIGHEVLKTLVAGYQCEGPKRDAAAYFSGFSVVEIPSDRTAHPMSRGTPAPVPLRPSQPRNDKCACGSGKKYKKCCGY